MTQGKVLDILAFGAHPDDVELGCGGTLLKLAKLGYRTGIVDLTRGEMGTRGTPEEREKEAQSAAQLLKADLRVNLRIPDANIENSKENQLKVIECIREYTPRMILLPYPEDRHPDHIHASHLVKEAAFYSGLKKLQGSSLPPHRPSRLIYYMMTNEFTPSFIVDISEEFEGKIAALKAHTSQFHNPEYPGEETFISSRNYWEAIEFRARHFGWLAGVR
ncbi:MAG: bacillithiol biosynthesis deacetylase BshB1, partial [Methanobacteriota archaeon]